MTSDFQHAVDGSGPYAQPFSPYAPVGHGEPTYGPAHAADLPVQAPQLGAETAGSPVITTGIDPTRPCLHTASDVFMSLNGFDEIAIAQRFGATVSELREDPVTFGRALAFVDLRRRRSLRDDEAYTEAMTLTISTVTTAYFQPEPPKSDASAEGNAAPA